MTVLDATVVIPVHNRAGVLRAAVESVLAQTLGPRRIIVVDDGSSDSSVEVAAALPVELLRHAEARGSGPARNTGIAAADTEWIAFLDSDDVWAPDHLERVAPELDGRVLVTTPMIDSFGRARGNVAGRAAAITHDRLFFPENIVCTSTAVASTRAVREVGGFNPLPRAQDLDLWIRMLDVGPGLALAHPTALYAVPEQYQEPGLRARSLAGAQRVREGYAGAPWMTRRLEGRIRAQLAWDDLRHAQHHRDASAVLRGARRLATSPGALGSLRDLLRYRRDARRLAATVAWS